MKQKVTIFLLMVIAVAGVFALSSKSNALTITPFNINLSVGNSGYDVRRLQQFLAEGGYFTDTATGYFGNITKEAVISFQLANNVIADRTSPGAGNFGPNTRAAANKIIADNLARATAPPPPDTTPPAPPPNTSTGNNSSGVNSVLPTGQVPSVPSSFNVSTAPSLFHKYFSGKVKFIFICTCHMPPWLYIKTDGQYGPSDLIIKPLELLSNPGEAAKSLMDALTPNKLISGDAQEGTAICSVGVDAATGFFCMPTPFSGKVIRSLNAFSGL